MQLISILLQLLFIFQSVVLINGLFFSKSKKHDQHHLIAAKYDPEMPKKVRQTLEEVGDYPILKIQLGRVPVQKVILLFLNLISSWKFNKKRIELGYDEIYHNYLLVTIQNEEDSDLLQSMMTNSEEDVSSKIYKLDKTQRIRLMETPPPPDNYELYEIPLTPNKSLTLNRLISVASNIDKQFYSYDAANNNMCQTFVENIVDINGLTPNIKDDETRMALKPQDAKALIATLGKRGDVVKRITDLGGRLDKLVNERQITWKKRANKEFALYGDMRIKPANDAENDDTDEVLRSTENGVTISGTSDIVVENLDTVFDAVTAFEEEHKRKERQKMTIKIVGIVLGTVLILGIAAAIGFFVWRQRKSKLQQKELDDKTKRTSNLNEVSEATSNE